MAELLVFNFDNRDVYTFRRETLNNCLSYFVNLENNDLAVLAISKDRAIPEATLKEACMFYVDQDIIYANIPAEYREDIVGICYKHNVVMRGRMVFPIKDVLGNVAGFVGWDKFVKPKYLDSRTYGYEAKKCTLFGMENISEYYTSTKPVFIVEGLFCSLWLRSQCFQSLALLGSHINNYIKIILLRFGRRLIFLCDNDNYDREISKDDAASEDFIKSNRKRFPKALFLQCRSAKDVNDAVRLNEEVKQNLIRDLQNIYKMSYSELQLR